MHKNSIADILAGRRPSVSLGVGGLVACLAVVFAVEAPACNVPVGILGGQAETGDGSTSGGGAIDVEGDGGAGLPGEDANAGAGTSGTVASGVDPAVVVAVDAAVDAAVAVAAQPAGPGESIHFVVYGDTRSNAGTHQKVVDAYAKLNPQLVIHTGDLWNKYSGGTSQWTGIITKNANIGALLQKNLFLVAQGNHESSSEVLGYKPTLVRNNALRYALTMGNAYFVILGMDPSSTAAVSFLQQQLATPEAKAATWRFAISHYPVWSGGDHPNDGYPALEKAMDAGNVTIHFGGHDHNYQRSYQLFRQKPVDMGDALMASTGTVFVVTGGGGAPLYSVQTIANTKTVKSINHFVEVTSDATTVDVKAWTVSGQLLDAFKITR